SPAGASAVFGWPDIRLRGRRFRGSLPREPARCPAGWARATEAGRGMLREGAENRSGGRAGRPPKKSSAALEGCLTHRSPFGGSSVWFDVPRLVADPWWTLMKLVALRSVV